MRLKNAVVLCLASLVTLIPMSVRGESPPDPRLAVRQQAAKILQEATRGPNATAAATLERYRSSIRLAIELIGQKSHTAAELVDALDAAAPTADALDQLRDRVNEISQQLAFAPLMEAEMPVGFPMPTPAGEIEIKEYPAYRMAQAEATSGSAFWTLFNHIKQNKVAMTAPVEMGYRWSESAGAKQQSMAFLYGNSSLGQTGADGSVQVVDVAPATVVSIGIRGERTQQKTAEARKQLVEWLDINSKDYKATGDMRVLGYNSPFVPRDRKYFEVQFPVRAKEADGGSPGRQIPLALTE